MEGFGIDKLLITLLIVMVLFGAKRIPEIGSSLGKGIREFKRGMNDLGQDLDASRESDPGRLSPPAPVAASREPAREPAREPKRLLI
jgi:sec-independent protein translocase protein TatA